MNPGNPSRAGKAPRRTYRFCIQDIAKAVSKTTNAVFCDWHRKPINPRNLSELAAYIMRCQAKANRPRKSRKRKALPSVPPNSPESTS